MAGGQRARRPVVRVVASRNALGVRHVILVGRRLADVHTHRRNVCDQRQDQGGAAVRRLPGHRFVHAQRKLHHRLAGVRCPVQLLHVLRVQLALDHHRLIHYDRDQGQNVFRDRADAHAALIVSIELSSFLVIITQNKKSKIKMYSKMYM